MNHDRTEEYRQALRDLRNAENYFNVCESGNVVLDITNLGSAEARLNAILKEIRYEKLDEAIFENKKSR